MTEDAWEPEKVVETTFLDGKRFIPHHLAIMMNGLPTPEMRFTEAVDAANRRAVGDILGRAQQNIVRDHFARRRHGPDY